MVDGENTVVSKYEVKSKIQNPKSKIQIELKPLLAFRDYHHLRREDMDFNGSFETAEDQISIQPYPEMPKLFFAHNAFSQSKKPAFGIVIFNMPSNGNAALISRKIYSSLLV